jgi:hypothetical protein
MGKNGNQVLCDVMSMDAFHVLLDRPWLYYRRVFHDGMKNTYHLIREEQNLDYIWKLMRMMEIMVTTRLCFVQSMNSWKE